MTTGRINQITVYLAQPASFQQTGRSGKYSETPECGLTSFPLSLSFRSVLTALPGSQRSRRLTSLPRLGIPLAGENWPSTLRPRLRAIHSGRAANTDLGRNFELHSGTHTWLATQAHTGTTPNSSLPFTTGRKDLYRSADHSQQERNRSTPRTRSSCHKAADHANPTRFRF